MESKSFVKLLRKVVREEVRKAVKDALNEQKVNHKQVMDHGMDLHSLTEQPRAKKKFTKNSMLNDILNETAASADFSTMREGPVVMQEEYPSIGNFKSEMAESFGISRPPQSLANTGINGEAVNMNNETVAKTVNAMTKDYSAMMNKMKEMDKQKGKNVI
jgi:hypothetical protein